MQVHLPAAGQDSCADGEEDAAHGLRKAWILKARLFWEEGMEAAKSLAPSFSKLANLSSFYKHGPAQIHKIKRCISSRPPSSSACT